MSRHILITLIFFLGSLSLTGQSFDIDKSLKGFDAYVQTVMKDWNAPGIAVGIVVKDKLVFAKGYGYRDLENKLPVTPQTLFPIASNTKLFTAVAAGFLVEDGKLAWDQPIKKYDASIEFYNQDLNEGVTLRDMLSHRTGISRHDGIWYKSTFTRKEMFDRIRFLEPSQPLRQGYLYNNLMYMGVGTVMEHITGKTWEEYVREKLFKPLVMSNTTFTIGEMEKRPDFAFPYYEERDTTVLKKYPFYRQMDGVGPCGSIISNIDEISHWLIALMNKGKYGNQQVIPESVLAATLQPAMAVPNTNLETKGYTELFNSVYGMGRYFSSYKGHYLTYHGGAIGGFYSQVSTMLYDGIGVIVLVNGVHTSPMIEIVSRNIYDRLLNVSRTPWHDRLYKDYIAGKKASKESRKKVSTAKVADTRPSHAIEDYSGEFENAAYGIVGISVKENSLKYSFNGDEQPLIHYHYDRFDTPDDVLLGKTSMNFSTNPQGEIDKLLISMDEAEVAFSRKPDAALTDPAILLTYTGKYETPSGGAVEIRSPDSKTLYLVYPGQPQYELIPYKPRTFKMKQFSDTIIQFIAEDNRITGYKNIDPAGELFVRRK